MNNRTKHNTRLLVEMNTAIPSDFVRLYKANALIFTPRGKTSWLRRSIVTQAGNGTARISWRAEYAKAQDEGGHRVNKPIKGPNQRDGGFGTIMPGYYSYRNGKSGFLAKTSVKTQSDMIPLLRQRGYTK